MCSHVFGHGVSLLWPNICDRKKRFDFSVANYVHLVANAMGIHRDDKFKRYVLWRDLDRILEDANENILESPFEKERIIEVLQTVFVK